MVDFSEVAESYDQEFTFSQIGIYQRKRIWKHLLKYIIHKPSVLEVNCGTGIDAMLLNKLRCDVLATDASEEMIKVAKNNITNNNLNFNKITDLPLNQTNNGLQFKTSDFKNLNENVSGRKFDIIFSNFGGLNCIDKNQLQQVFQNFYTLLNENGKLIIVMIAPKCIWEKLYFKLKGEGKKADRRQNKEGAETVIANQHFKTYYFSTEEIKNTAENKFEVIEHSPVGLFIPPSYLNKFFNNKKIVLKFLNLFDNIFSFSFLSNYADHYFMVLQKTGKG